MAVVSISEAARLTGKSRRTIQRHIGAGKLSKVAGCDSIDTSDLIRVYGEIKDVSMARDNAGVTDGEKSHSVAINGTAVADEKSLKIMELEAKLDKANAIIEGKEKLLNAKQETIDSLNNAMRLLEDQRQKTSTAENAESKKEEPKGFFQRLFKR